MHEFSLAFEVIKVTEQAAEKNRAACVKEITIEIGSLSGVEADAFESALGLLSEGSVLDNAVKNIIRIKAKGVCLSCSREFEMNQRMDTCPECHAFPSEISGGNEFRVVSIMIEKE